MKKIVMIATMLITSINVSIAQQNITDNREKFQLVLKTGLNYSNVYDEKGNEYTADPKFGYVVGGVFDIPIGRYIGIQPGVLLSQKGFQGSGSTILGGSYYFTRTTTHLDVPLQFAVKPSEFVTLVAGPQYSYLLAKKEVFTNSSSTTAQEQEFENDYIRKNVFGFVGGADLNINHFTLGARVNWDVQNNNGDGTATSPRYKNVWYQATIGYRFYDN